jgi:hypothetical protein
MATFISQNADTSKNANQEQDDLLDGFFLPTPKNAEQKTKKPKESIELSDKEKNMLVQIDTQIQNLYDNLSKGTLKTDKKVTISLVGFSEGERTRAFYAIDKTCTNIMGSRERGKSGLMPYFDDKPRSDSCISAKLLEKEGNFSIEIDLSTVPTQEMKPDGTFTKECARILSKPEKKMPITSKSPGSTPSTPINIRSRNTPNRNSWTEIVSSPFSTRRPPMPLPAQSASVPSPIPSNRTIAPSSASQEVGKWHDYTTVRASTSLKISS